MRDGHLPEFMFGERWSTKTLNWRKTGPARPKTASQSSATLNCLLFSLAGHFGMLFSRTRLQRRRCARVARVATSQTPCQSSGRYCVVPLNLLAPPWMLWRAFWPPLSQRCFLQVSVLDPAENCPSLGMCHSDFGTGSQVYVAFVRLQVPKRAMRVAGRLVAAEPVGTEGVGALRGHSWLPAWLGYKPHPFGLGSGPASMQALL